MIRDKLETWLGSDWSKLKKFACMINFWRSVISQGKTLRVVDWMKSLVVNDLEEDDDLKLWK